MVTVFFSTNQQKLGLNVIVGAVAVKFPERSLILKYDCLDALFITVVKEVYGPV